MYYTGTSAYVQWTIAEAKGFGWAQGVLPVTKAIRVMGALDHWNFHSPRLIATDCIDLSLVTTAPLWSTFLTPASWQ